MDAQAPEKWRPLTGMPDGAEGWATPGFADLEAEWADCQRQLKVGSPESRFLDGWLRERVRAFALETGQIEGLYTLRRGVTEQLIAEGFAGAVGSHTFEGLEDQTVRGLLEDQEGAYDMMFDDVASGRPLSAYMIKSWHALLTRHQDTVAGIDPQGRRVEVEFRGKGQWKTRPNNPRRPDGVVHEYCPPEQVEPEMRRFLDLYNDDIRHRDYPVNVEAAWLHHRFVRTHPFQDGNGRVSRQLMAWAYVKRSLPPPVVTAQGKLVY
ncbi:MAG: Fic family protein, partial [Gammaproteobacteria bacterium]|nr:Fic family protein [Gammaproteobacteria bacterium]